jgi:hypothetical protein
MVAVGIIEAFWQAPGGTFKVTTGFVFTVTVCEIAVDVHVPPGALVTNATV